MVPDEANRGQAVASRPTGQTNVAGVAQQGMATASRKNIFKKARAMNQRLCQRPVFPAITTPLRPVRAAVALSSFGLQQVRVRAGRVFHLFEVIPPPLTIFAILKLIEARPTNGKQPEPTPMPAKPTPAPLNRLYDKRHWRRF